jgi:hypothetical protein
MLPKTTVSLAETENGFELHISGADALLMSLSLSLSDLRSLYRVVGSAIRAPRHEGDGKDRPVAGGPPIAYRRCERENI